MLDANNRPIKIGDWVATPYDTGNLLDLAGAIKDAILGQVTELIENPLGEFVALGDVTHMSDEIVTLGGLEWVTCEGCGFSWPFDVRMSEREECPDCEALLIFDVEGS